MKAAMKALGSGVLAVGGTLAFFFVGGSWLWQIAIGNVIGPVALVMAPLGLIVFFMGLVMLTVIGDAMDEWEG